MAIRVIDDSKLQNIAVAIQDKDGGGTMTVDEMPTRIAAIPTRDNTTLNSLIDRSITSIENEEVTSIGAHAFHSCKNLTGVSLPNVTSIGFNAFQNCTNLTSVSLPNVTSIGSNAFQNCPNLTSVSLPNVTSIDSYAFQNCYSLTATNIPAGVTSIGISAFQNCYSLTATNIPAGVASIGSYAFQSCRKLYDVVIHGKPTLSNTDAFSGAPPTQKFYVHRSDLSWFETETNWSTIYASGKIVAAADYLDHLISIGIDVTDFENEVISE